MNRYLKFDTLVDLCEINDFAKHTLTLVKIQKYVNTENLTVFQVDSKLYDNSCYTVGSYEEIRSECSVLRDMLEEIVENIVVKVKDLDKA